MEEKTGGIHKLAGNGNNCETVKDFAFEGVKL